MNFGLSLCQGLRIKRPDFSEAQFTAVKNAAFPWDLPAAFVFSPLLVNSEQVCEEFRCGICEVAVFKMVV
jgi:hypothetical protein